MGERGDRVTLVGLDIGSTTSRAAVADARVLRSAAAGRPEIGHVEERYRAEPARTPFLGDALDERALLALVDGWLHAAGAEPGAFFGGGALLTGLAARAPNSPAIVEALRSRAGGAVVATAGDPRLEAWLAFHGNAGDLSRAAPGRPLLNIDIGGGTTNMAVGLGGEVLSTGWMWVGARHVEVEPGTYRMIRCSPEARSAMAHLGIDRHPGEVLSPGEVESILDVWMDLLEAAVLGRAPRSPIAGEEPLVPAPLALPADCQSPDLAFSGGVGALFYDLLAGRELPPVTHYGDLGIDLARRIASSRVLSGRVVVPEGLGRATVYGLLRHQTQVSGSTVFLPQEVPCPTGDLPILGAIGPAPDEASLRRLVALSRVARPAGCLRVRGPIEGAPALRALGRAIGAALREAGGEAPLVVLVEQNVAKALGGYATEWGRAPLPLVVLDEVTPRGAELVRIGTPRGGFVPLSFHRMSG